LRIPVVTVSDSLGNELLATAGDSPKALQTGIDRDLSSLSRALPDTRITSHLVNQLRSRGITHNVAGLLRGTDRGLSAETIVISAHHDHDGWTEDSAGLQIWHGADDNASGTAGVVELAHAFAGAAAKSKRSILFVVFAAGERGLLGAYYMAAHPLRPLVTTRAMINFDMIGRDEAPSEQTKGLMDIPANTRNRVNFIGGKYSPDVLRTVLDANQTVGLDIDRRFDHEYILNTFFRSDQFPFVLHHVPAAWFATGFHPDYHQITDTANKINYEKMVKILRLTFLSVWLLANERVSPTFLSDPAGGQ
jgi:Zn-dependent M28 family amino/carboxypeptidase